MKIDIWSDIMCPYCYVGKRNLSLALKELDLDKEAEIVYHSFELNPKAKSEGERDTMTYLIEEYGVNTEQAQKMLDRIIGMGKAAGLELNFDTVIQTNTFNAHRLIHFSKRYSKELETVEALFKATFIDSLNVGDIQILGDIGNEVGLNREEVIDMLKTDEFFSEVNNDKYKAVELDINSVPYFIINDKYAVPGAQPVKVFMEVFKKANEDKES